MTNSQIIIVVIASGAALLQALVLFVLKDIKTTIESQMPRDLCNEKYRNISRRVSNLENKCDVTGSFRLLNREES